MKSLTVNLKKRLWKTFLRIGHDLVWRADEWFQKQERALVQPALDRQLYLESQAQILNGATVAPISLAHGVPDIGEKNESHDGEHEQDANFKRNDFQSVGGDHGKGRALRSAGQSFGEWQSGKSAKNNSGNVTKAQRTGFRNGGSARNPRRSLAQRQARPKLTAASFDSRMSLQLAKTRPVM